MAEAAKLHLKLETVTGIAVDGESEIAGFEKQIELLDWSWNLSREHAAKSGVMDAWKPERSGKSVAGNPEGTVVPEPFRFSKRMDRSTTAMLSALTKGTLMKAEVTLTETISKAASRNDGFHMVVFLDSVRVIEYSLDGDVDDSFGELKEKWTFNFEKLRFRYRKPGGAGVIDVDLRRKPGDSTEVSNREATDEEIVLRFARQNKAKVNTIIDLMKKAGISLKPA